MTDLYQKLILDHAKNPRHFQRLTDADRIIEGNNPLCGDRFEGFLQTGNAIVTRATFHGDGCAIATASASLLADTITNRSVVDAQDLLRAFADGLTQKEVPTKTERERLGKPSALLAVRDYPSRIKCASLPARMFLAALGDEKGRISTED